MRRKVLGLTDSFLFSADFLPYWYFKNSLIIFILFTVLSGEQSGYILTWGLLLPTWKEVGEEELHVGLGNDYISAIMQQSTLFLSYSSQSSIWSFSFGDNVFSQEPSTRANAWNSGRHLSKCLHSYRMQSYCWGLQTGRNTWEDVKLFQKNFLERTISPFKSKSPALIFSNESERIVLTKGYLISIFQSEFGEFVSFSHATYPYPVWESMLESLQRDSWDGRVKRPWAFLLSWAHQNHNYLQMTVEEKDVKLKT